MPLTRSPEAQIVPVSPAWAETLVKPMHLPVPMKDAAFPRRARVDDTAVVYCEANFGRIHGKTANGLVRHSEKYKILSVIDSQQSGA